MANPLEFPLAERELTVRGRRLGTYALRVAAPGFVFVCAALVLAFGTVRGEISPDTASSLGRFMGHVAHLFQQFCALLLCVLWAAPVIAQEREDRTLSLLQLADRGGWNIYFGKFLGVFLPTVLLIVGVLPLAAIASLLGGIPVAGLAVETLSLVIAAAAGTALGLCCSAWPGRSGVAIPLGLIAATCWLAGGMLLTYAVGGTWNFSVYRGLRSLDMLWVLPELWAPGALYNLAVCALASLAVVYRLPRLTLEPVAAHRASKRRQRPRRAVSAERIILSGAGGIGGSISSVPLKWLIALMLPVVILVPCLGYIIVFVAMIHEVAAAMGAARRQGIVDDLFVTPMNDRAVARVLYRAALWRCWMYAPAIVVLCLFWTIFGLFMGAANGILGLGELWIFSTLWIIGGFSVAASLVTAVIYYCVTVAIGCYVSTLSMRLGAQCAVGGILYTVLAIVSGFITGPLQAIGMAFLHSSTQGVAFIELAMYAGTQLIVITLYWAAIVTFYALFQYRLRTLT